jgi:hypothetical protein
MKRSELKQLILESIQELKEDGPNRSSGGIYIVYNYAERSSRYDIPKLAVGVFKAKNEKDALAQYNEIANLPYQAYAWAKKSTSEDVEKLKNWIELNQLKQETILNQINTIQ